MKNISVRYAHDFFGDLDSSSVKSDTHKPGLEKRKDILMHDALTSSSPELIEDI